MRLIAAALCLMAWIAPLRAQSHPQEVVGTWVTVYEEWGPNRVDSMFYDLQSNGRYSLRQRSMQLNSRGWTVRRDTTVYNLRWAVVESGRGPALCLRYRNDDICQKYWFSNEGRKLWIGLRPYTRTK